MLGQSIWGIALTKPFVTLNSQISCPVWIRKALAVSLGTQLGILCNGSITFLENKKIFFTLNLYSRYYDSVYSGNKSWFEPNYFSYFNKHLKIDHFQERIAAMEVEPHPHPPSISVNLSQFTDLKFWATKKWKIGPTALVVATLEYYIRKFDWMNYL